MNNLKIGDELISKEILIIFENESPIVNSLKYLKMMINKLVLIIIIYVFVMFFIRKYIILELLLALTFLTFIHFYLYKRAGIISHLCSKDLGGKPVLLLKRKDKMQYKEDMTYNIKLMRKKELYILKKILRINKITKLESLKELRNTYETGKKTEPFEIHGFVKEMSSIYFIPILFNIISIYLSINVYPSIEQKVLGISYIILCSAVILSILSILYFIHKLKKFSITKVYTHQRLNELLTDIIIKS